MFCKPSTYSFIVASKQQDGVPPEGLELHFDVKFGAAVRSDLRFGRIPRTTEVEHARLLRIGCWPDEGKNEKKFVILSENLRKLHA